MSIISGDFYILVNKIQIRVYFDKKEQSGVCSDDEKTKPNILISFIFFCLY